MMAKRAFTRWKGRVKREVGEATGDRRVEAKGTVEARTGTEPDDEGLGRAEQAVRRKHRDTSRGPRRSGRRR
jgi:uncharacterized protein YjbJ (UPF0337 family)